MEYKYFIEPEFHCKCDRQHEFQIVDERLIWMLDLARDRAGLPFVINSGYRCLEHNTEVGGVVNSAHLKGLAADIHAENLRARYIILKALLSIGFSRIGIGPNFIHTDIDATKETGVVWLYE
jgi:uncharacterized protein YcbK (DUF882 family)